MDCSQTSLPGLSPELKAAQERLLQLRKELLVEQGASHRHSRMSQPEKTPKQLLDKVQAELHRRREQAGVRVKKAPTLPSSDWINSLFAQHSQLQSSQAPATDPTPTHSPETVPVYPSILTAVLKEHLEAAGRLYLLLYHLDSQGRGWLSVEQARNKLTDKSSRLRVCGWRRLRQLLRQGEDIFWRRDHQNRLWLRGPHKIAQKLGLERLEGSRIDLPLKALLGGIQAVRAHFYAAFHSGRRKSAPVSRECLKNITGLPERTQRAYDHLSATKRQHNMAIGPRYNKETAENQAWKRGRGMFRFVDSQGQQGAPKREYVAWHLPNSYTGPHSTRCKGRQKRINQRLNSLVTRGMRGNVHEQVEKLFWPNGAMAGRAYNREGDNDAYWPQNQAGRETHLLWHVLEGV